MGSNDSIFRLQSPWEPAGDQPKAIRELLEGLHEGHRDQTLLGVTGSGKTFTMAHVIAQWGRPTLIVSHNKTLAAQLYEEMKEFFPENAVEYFVSYYDYYQPEAYIPSRDLYIAKEADINEEIERLRLSTTQSLVTRRDVVVVASVSCIYSLGDPRDYRSEHVEIRVGSTIGRKNLLRSLVDIQYVRNDTSPGRGSFRVRGDTIDIFLADGTGIIRVELFGEEVESLSRLHPTTGAPLEKLSGILVPPAQHFVTPPEEMERITRSILEELEERLQELKALGKELEARRLEERTRFDVELLRETGHCPGIENYSRHFTGKAPGEPPYTLLDYFPPGFLTIIDESHVTVPQIRGMYSGDRSRKEILVEHGFRLPSALDNRPLTFEEFRARVGETIYVSATPGPFERSVSTRIVEQIVRPTGLLDPEVEVRPSSGQVDDLLGEARLRVARNERVLVTTLTKRMAEDLASYLSSHGLRVRYLHSEVETLERIDLLEDLRRGAFDVLVGVNLLREGLDLPEVGLVAILDADKEGFLRSRDSLIQTMGRASRNVSGKVILYADERTGALEEALRETERRRAIQSEYNRIHGIVPRSVQKGIRSMRVRPSEKELLEEAERLRTREELEVLITRLEGRMRRAASLLDFEEAARIRDLIRELKRRGPSPG